MRGAKFAPRNLEKTIDRLLGEFGSRTRRFEEEKGTFAVRRSTESSPETGHPNERIRRATKTSRRENPPSRLFRLLSNPPVPGSCRCYRAPEEGCSAIVTENRAVDSPPDPSETTTVNGTFPVVPGDVTQRTHPVPRSMLIPAGASFKENINGSPSASDART